MSDFTHAKNKPNVLFWCRVVFFYWYHSFGCFQYNSSCIEFPLKFFAHLHHDVKTKWQFIIPMMLWIFFFFFFKLVIHFAREERMQKSNETPEKMTQRTGRQQPRESILTTHTGVRAITSEFLITPLNRSEHKHQG